PSERARLWPTSCDRVSSRERTCRSARRPVRFRYDASRRSPARGPPSSASSAHHAPTTLSPAPRVATSGTTRTPPAAGGGAAPGAQVSQAAVPSDASPTPNATSEIASACRAARGSHGPLQEPIVTSASTPKAAPSPTPTAPAPARTQATSRRVRWEGGGGAFSGSGNGLAGSGSASSAGTWTTTGALAGPAGTLTATTNPLCSGALAVIAWSPG